MAVLVKQSSGGSYEIVGEPEDWDAIRAEADATERVAQLTGWGEYTSLYTVEINGAVALYMVAG